MDKAQFAALLANKTAEQIIEILTTEFPDGEITLSDADITEEVIEEPPPVPTNVPRVDIQSRIQEMAKKNFVGA